MTLFFHPNTIGDGKYTGSFKLYNGTMEDEVLKPKKVPPSIRKVLRVALQG